MKIECLVAAGYRRKESEITHAYVRHSSTGDVKGLKYISKSIAPTESGAHVIFPSLSPPSLPPSPLVSVHSVFSSVQVG